MSMSVRSVLLGVVEQSCASSNPTATPTSMPIARLLGDQRPHGGEPLVGVGDAGGSRDLVLVGSAEPAAGLERLVEDPLELRGRACATSRCASSRRSGLA